MSTLSKFGATPIDRPTTCKEDTNVGALLEDIPNRQNRVDVRYGELDIFRVGNFFRIDLRMSFVGSGFSITILVLSMIVN